MKTKIHKKGYHYKIITIAEYNSIKALLNAGVTEGLASKATKRSWAVIKFIKQSSSLDEYRTLIAEYCKKKSKVVEIIPTPDKESRDYPRMLALLDTIVLRQMDMSQDIAKIKRRLLIKN